MVAVPLAVFEGKVSALTDVIGGEFPLSGFRPEGVAVRFVDCGDEALDVDVIPEDDRL